ncbi:MAG: sulfite exporter TauE/SafE family protein [Candidatus Heimdallarchaeota archaeon]
MLDPIIVFFILIPIGIVVGIVAAVTGLGGGILMVPVLFFGIFNFVQTIFPEFPPLAYATTISSTVIIFTAISGTIAFSIQKRIDYIVGLICAPFTIAGSIIGKFTQPLVGETFLKIFLIVLFILTSVRMIYKVVKTRRDNKIAAQEDCPVGELNGESTEEEIKEPTKFHVFLDKLTLKRSIDDNCDQSWNYEAKLILAPIALIGGYVAATAGVGGGIIMVPVLTIFLGLPMHFATATSVFIMIFTKTTTLITAYATPDVVTEGIWWPFVVGLAIGVIGGVQIGALIAKRIKSDPLKLIFAILIVIVAIWTILQMTIPGLSA